jgi:hypothetical protein
MEHYALPPECDGRSIRHEHGLAFAVFGYPKGITASSPGLRGTSYPGKTEQKSNPNLNEVARFAQGIQTCGLFKHASLMRVRKGHNSIGVVGRVAEFTQGSFPRGGKTLGFEAKSLWDKES